MTTSNPAVIRRLMREVNQLRAEPLEGIRVITNEENMLDVTGIIEGPTGTPYAGGYFKVRFQFGEDFPAAPPKCWFATKIFHPNVSKAGDICVNTLKKDWKKEYGIGHILTVVRCLLIYPNPESALDEEAGKLLLENYDDYCRHARLITSVHATSKVFPAGLDSPIVAASSASTSFPIADTGDRPAEAPSTTSTAVSLTSITSPNTLLAGGPPKPLSKSGNANTPLQPSTNSSNTPQIPAPAAIKGAPGSAPVGTKKRAGVTAGGTEKRKKALKRL